MWAGKVMASVFCNAHGVLFITETNAYFEAKDKSFYKKGIEMLEKRWTDCVAFEGNYVD